MFIIQALRLQQDFSFSYIYPTRDNLAIFIKLTQNPDRHQITIGNTFTHSYFFSDIVSKYSLNMLFSRESL